MYEGTGASPGSIVGSPLTGKERRKGPHPLPSDPPPPRKLARAGSIAFCFVHYVLGANWKELYGEVREERVGSCKDSQVVGNQEILRKCLAKWGANIL